MDQDTFWDHVLDTGYVYIYTTDEEGKIFNMGQTNVRGGVC
jgi:hypothetical protein